MLAYVYVKMSNTAKNVIYASHYYVTNNGNTIYLKITQQNVSECTVHSRTGKNARFNDKLVRFKLPPMCCQFIQRQAGDK